MKPVFENGLAVEPGDIRCFYYDALTYEYTGWSDEFINIGVSMPANCCDIDPGDAHEGFVNVFNGNSWESKEDHRGEVVYDVETREPFLITEIGPYPEGTTTTKPEPTNDEKRKNALLNLSQEYQSDILQLNTAWLAAAVSDGINETTKKDSVIAQINDRKVRYSQDRASIIAKYPED
ncbi:tail fiber assembly protein [Salmonella enterica]|nr:tail fiber assembly protein [Salmonella enterica]